MGKTKIVKEKSENTDTEKDLAKVKVSSKKKVVSAILNVEATFNNTKATLADKNGNVVFWTSSGSLGFKGAKKGTPFAASKVGDLVGSKAVSLGVNDANVVIKGVGSGREPVVRAFMAHGIELLSIKDVTPVPHNGPKPKKPRRV